MSSVRRAVFLDRDGTINVDVHHCRRVEDFHVLPGVPEALSTLAKAGFTLVVITNQSVIGRGWLTEEGLERIHAHMQSALAGGARVDAIYHCPHAPEDVCDCRKPKPALILRAAREMGLDLSASYMVGDAETDILAGAAAGCRTALVSPELIPPPTARPDYLAKDLPDAARWVIQDSAQRGRAVA